MGSAPVVPAPSFISSLSRVAFHPATDSVNGVGGLQLDASRRSACWGRVAQLPQRGGCSPPHAQRRLAAATWVPPSRARL